MCVNCGVDAELMNGIFVSIYWFRGGGEIDIDSTWLGESFNGSLKRINVDVGADSDYRVRRYLGFFILAFPLI